MKNLICFFLIITVCICSNNAFAQDSIDFDFGYEVRVNYPPLSIPKNKIETAKTISDLNPHYKSEWVRTFKSVNISTKQNGQIQQFISKDDILTKEQIEAMKKADAASQVSIVIEYIPENTLSSNDIHTFDFDFLIDPDQQASFIGGTEKLNEYLQENAFGKISETKFRQHQLTAVKFTVDEKGEIINPHVFESSKDEFVDELLLNTIKKMPCWSPAEYADGLKVSQDFVLTAGDHRSCVINLFNLRQERN